ncbi:MAG: HipA domain-containing protein [Verrucomicrobiales bacterium]|nr:HipA domain-containing protein [Verrucomicrobiales bacterium]
MDAEYAILKIDPDWGRTREPLGSKPKFWFWYQSRFWLFKEVRKNTGEHWAEKVASEIADELGLPTHHTELATFEGRDGCAVRSFLETGEVLVHGNEILAGTIDDYDKDKIMGQADHNIGNVVKVLERWFSGPEAGEVAANRVVGYLLLDALIGNTDRHHENWGIVGHPIHHDKEGESADFVVEIAPTFDHASSLGRELLDERREAILNEQGALVRYIGKARGGIFENSNARKGMSPMGLVELIAERYPEFFKPWQRRLAEIDEAYYSSIVNRVPESWMNECSKNFALAFLSETRKLLLQIK